MTTISKEIKYGMRNNIFLILTAGFLFFALMAPVMAKILPKIMQSQFPHLPQEQIDAMLNFNQAEIIRSFLGDILEIVVIIVAFTLCGLLAQEIKEHTLVLPLSSGKRTSEIISAKIIVFGAALIMVSVFAVLVNYLMPGYFFFEVEIIAVVRRFAAGTFPDFFACFSAAVKGPKPLAAGFLPLIIVYGQYGLASL